MQLGLNLAWSWIFFRKHAITAAFTENVCLWITIGTTTLVFSRIAAVAAWLMLPYLLWVTFAAFLNGALAQLNRSVGSNTQTHYP
jgi:tryptophan-rich sensory protein